MTWKIERDGRKGCWLEGEMSPEASPTKMVEATVLGEGDHEGERGLAFSFADWPWWPIKSVLIFFFQFGVKYPF